MPRFVRAILLLAIAFAATPAFACRMPPDLHMVTNGGYGAGDATDRRGFRFRSVLIVDVVDSVATGEHFGLDKLWVAWGNVNTVVFGERLSGRIGFSRGIGSSCEPTFERPKTGQKWVLYYWTPRPDLPLSNTWIQAYPLERAQTFDDRLPRQPRPTSMSGGEE